MDKLATDRFRSLVLESAPELSFLEEALPDVWAELQEEFVPARNPHQLVLLDGGMGQ